MRFRNTRGNVKAKGQLENGWLPGNPTTRPEKFSHHSKIKGTSTHKKT